MCDTTYEQPLLENLEVYHGDPAPKNTDSLHGIKPDPTEAEEVVSE